MNYPNLAAAVATRYPNANEQTRDRLCRSALHETAHLFVARIVDANPYKLRIQRSGAGWIHVHSHDEREILISLAGVAMEYRIEGDYSRELPATFDDFNDAERWCMELWDIERPGIIAGKILRDLVTMYGWPDVWRLIEETAVRAITKARKADGILSADKTDAVCKWLDGELKRSGLGEELSPLRNRVRLTATDTQKTV